MQEIKTLNIRLLRDQWLFLKHKAMENDISMNELLRVLVDRHQRKCEKKVDSQ
jgi:hypothetical protein